MPLTSHRTARASAVAEPPRLRPYQRRWRSRHERAVGRRRLRVCVSQGDEPPPKRVKPTYDDDVRARSPARPPPDRTLTLRCDTLAGAAARPQDFLGPHPLAVLHCQHPAAATLAAAAAAGPSAAAAVACLSELPANGRTPLGDIGNIGDLSSADMTRMLDLFVLGRGGPPPPTRVMPKLLSRVCKAVWAVWRG